MVSVPEMASSPKAEWLEQPGIYKSLEGSPTLGSFRSLWSPGARGLRWPHPPVWLGSCWGWLASGGAVGRQIGPCLPRRLAAQMYSRSSSLGGTPSEVCRASRGQALSSPRHSTSFCWPPWSQRGAAQTLEVGCALHFWTPELRVGFVISLPQSGSQKASA